MTRQEIIAAISAAEQTAATLRRLLIEIDGTPPPSAAAPYRRGPFIDTGRAEQITRMSRSWLYKLVHVRPDAAWKIETGAVRYSQPALLEIIAGMGPREQSVLSAESATATIHLTRGEGYLS